MIAAMQVIETLLRAYGFARGRGLRNGTRTEERACWGQAEKRERALAQIWEGGTAESADDGPNAGLVDFFM